ncbi:MAG: TonB-dependent receptor plug domain-containing protein, partial [Nannocystaceae bacterium]
MYALGSRDALAGARVAAVDGPEARTDEAGNFELWLAPGTYSVVLRADGYDDLKVEVTLADREDLEFEYRLAAARSGNRYRTVVRQEREVAVSKTTLSGDEIHAAPGTFGDPFRVVQSLPGAAQVAGFLPYVVVRGAAPGNTGYYLDGVRVPILFHVAVGPSVVHPYFIDSVDFYAGGAPVRLGRYSSGIIEGRTRQARRDRVRGDFDIRLTDAGGIVEVPFDRRRLPGCKEADRRKCPRGQARGSLTLAGRYSYTSAILSLVQSRAKISFWDYQARLDHRLGARSNYTAFFFGSYDELGEKAAPEPIVRFEFHRIVQRVRTHLRGDGVVDTTLALGLDRSGITAARVKEWRVAPRVDARIPLRRAENASIGFGLDQEFQVFRADLSSDDPISPGTVDTTAAFLNDRTVSATGLYADLLWSKGKVEIRPGVRADVYIQDGRSAVLPGARSITHAVGID